MEIMEKKMKNLLVLFFFLIPAFNSKCISGCRSCDVDQGSCNNCHFGFAMTKNQEGRKFFNTCQFSLYLVLPVCFIILFFFGLLGGCLKEKREFQKLEYEHCESMRKIHNSFRKDKIDGLTKLRLLPNTTIVAPANSFSSLVTSSHLT